MAKVDGKTVMMNVAAAFGAGSNGAPVSPAAVAFAYEVFGPHRYTAAQNWREDGPGICAWARALGAKSAETMLAGHKETVSAAHIKAAWKGMRADAGKPQAPPQTAVLRSAMSTESGADPDCPFCAPSA
jgi:hypothetical protein